MDGVLQSLGRSLGVFEPAVCVGDVNVPKSSPQLLGSGRSLFISSVNIRVSGLLLSYLANASNTSSNFHV